MMVVQAQSLPKDTLILRHSYTPSEQDTLIQAFLEDWKHQQDRCTLLIATHQPPYGLYLAHDLHINQLILGVLFPLYPGESTYLILVL